MLTTFRVYTLQVFGGLLVNLNTMFEWLNWMQYLSCARYSINVCIYTTNMFFLIYSFSSDHTYALFTLQGCVRSSVYSAVEAN